MHRNTLSKLFFPIKNYDRQTIDMEINHINKKDHLKYYYLINIQTATVG